MKNNNKDEALSLLHDLIAMSPQDVAVRLKEIEVGSRSILDDFNWLGLAETLADYAREDDATRESALAWGALAVHVYDRLARKKSESADSFEHSGNLVRAGLISKWGPIADDSLLDPRVIFRWFRERTALSLEEALRDAAHWESLDIARIRELRYTKNRLGIIKFLREANVEIPDDIAAWLDRRQELP